LPDLIRQSSKPGYCQEKIVVLGGRLPSQRDGRDQIYRSRAPLNQTAPFKSANDGEV
jgi:hypothetical protein